jgi:hypothetical protein
MKGQTAHSQVQTLGACLSKLGAGDPGPCCGARLKVWLAPQPVRPAPDADVAGRAESVVLACPGCGCEFSAGDGADGAGGCRSYGVAA